MMQVGISVWRNILSPYLRFVVFMKELWR